MYDRSKHIKQLCLIARLHMQSGLAPITKYKPKKQLKLVFIEIPTSTETQTENYDK